MKTADDAPVKHPRADDDGKPVLIQRPTKPSGRAAWEDANAVATFVPDGAVPSSLNGIPVSRWEDHPRTLEGWNHVDGVNDRLVEPPFKATGGKNPSAGVVIQEPDGRVWLISPTNAFGGYQSTFPKGLADPRLSLQATACKEAFEEAGLKVRITGFIGDFKRTTSIARMYRAVRVGGTPADMGWESQGVHLCTKAELYNYLNMPTDRRIVEADETIGKAPPRARVMDNVSVGVTLDPKFKTVITAKEVREFAGAVVISLAEEDRDKTLGIVKEFMDKHGHEEAVGRLVTKLFELVSADCESGEISYSGYDDACNELIMAW